MTMSYHTNKRVRSRIDKVLEANALLFANLGCDSSKSARAKAKAQERKSLRGVRNLDPQYVDSLLLSCD